MASHTPEKLYFILSKTQTCLVLSVNLLLSGDYENRSFNSLVLTFNQSSHLLMLFVYDILSNGTIKKTTQEHTPDKRILQKTYTPSAKQKIGLLLQLPFFPQTADHIKQ